MPLEGMYKTCNSLRKKCGSYFPQFDGHANEQTTKYFKVVIVTLNLVLALIRAQRTRIRKKGLS